MPTIHGSAFIAPNATVLGNVEIGAESSIWYTTVLRGDVDRIVVGSQTNIQDGTIVHVDEGFPALIGSRVGIGHRAIVHGCTIEDECLVGMGSVLLNGVYVGTGSVIAAGAVVPEGVRIPPGSLVMGVPGRIVRQVDPELAARIRGTWEHYVERGKEHKSGKWGTGGSLSGSLAR